MINALNNTKGTFDKFEKEKINFAFSSLYEKLRSTNACIERKNVRQHCLSLKFFACAMKVRFNPFLELEIFLIKQKRFHESSQSGLKDSMPAQQGTVYINSHFLPSGGLVGPDWQITSSACKWLTVLWQTYTANTALKNNTSETILGHGQGSSRDHVHFSFHL